MLGCMACLLFLFLFPKEVLIGAKSGLNLWFHIIFPTLLPFFILTGLCIELQLPALFPTFLYPVFIGLLSGFPVGAKSCSDLRQNGQLSRVQAQFFLSFCNNASPMFVLNYVLLQTLQLHSHLLPFLFFFYASILFSGLCFGIWHRQALFSFSYNKSKPDSSPTSATSDISFFQALDRSILNGFILITKIGGYIILFSIFATLLSSLLPVPSIIKGCLISLIEITTGIRYLSKLELSRPLLITLCMGFTSLGGLSSFAQTNSVLADSDLSIFSYIKYKALTAICCTGLCILYFHFFS